MKALEENGIGRPSTYGSILTTIQARDYTYKHDGKFHPTQLGMLVVKLLKQSFADIIDEGYTAELEEKLDEVEDGKLEWTDALREFSVKFNSDLERAGTEMTEVKGTGLETDEKCENCGSPMVIKFGRFGEFLACTNYPECKTTKEMPKGDAAEADVGRRADHLRQVRQADAAQALPLRPVLRLHRLSRLQEHQGPAS